MSTADGEAPRVAALLLLVRRRLLVAAVPGERGGGAVKLAARDLSAHSRLR